MRRRDWLTAATSFGLTSVAGCLDLFGESATIQVPETAFVDERIDISVTDIESEDRVWIEAETEDGSGNRWFGRGLFDPDDGTVHLQEASPNRGTYEQTAAMGLFWSMQPGEFVLPTYDTDQRTQSVRFRVVPETADDPIAERTVERHLAAPDSVETEITSPIVGTLVESPTDGPAPGIVLFHGSGGNRPLAPARMLARHGFTVLALQYFSPDVQTLPDALVEVPVEYADSAVDWLADHEATTEAQIGLGGISRGGELALLVGTRHDDVGAVVNWAGAGMLFNAVVLDENLDPAPDTPDTSAWSIDGEPLAHPSLEAFDQGGDLTEGYRTWIEETTPEETIHAAQIPLEEIGAPILLLSGGDDQVWPSRYLLDRTEQRLETVGYDHRFEHHSYDAAGHGIGVPSLPTWPNRSGGPFGGTIAGTAAAATNAWPRVLEFFELGTNQ